jgi:hypothetical protein
MTVWTKIVSVFQLLSCRLQLTHETPAFAEMQAQFLKEAVRVLRHAGASFEDAGASLAICSASP